jgi:hypothetical protein
MLNLEPSIITATSKSPYTGAIYQEIYASAASFAGNLFKPLEISPLVPAYLRQSWAKAKITGISLEKLRLHREEMDNPLLSPPSTSTLLPPPPQQQEEEEEYDDRKPSGDFVSTTVIKGKKGGSRGQLNTQASSSTTGNTGKTISFCPIVDSRVAGTGGSRQSSFTSFSQSGVGPATALSSLQATLSLGSLQNRLQGTDGTARRQQFERDSDNDDGGSVSGSDGRDDNEYESSVSDYDPYLYDKTRRKTQRHELLSPAFSLTSQHRAAAAVLADHAAIKEVQLMDRWEAERQNILSEGSAAWSGSGNYTLDTFVPRMLKTKRGEGFLGQDMDGLVYEIYSAKISGKGLERQRRGLYINGELAVDPKVQGSPNEPYKGVLFPETWEQFCQFRVEQGAVLQKSHRHDKYRRQTAFTNFCEEITTLAESLFLTDAPPTPQHIEHWARLWMYGFLRLRHALATGKMKYISGSFLEGWTVFKNAHAINGKRDPAGLLKQAMAMLGYYCTVCGNRNASDQTCIVCERMPKAGGPGGGDVGSVAGPPPTGFKAAKVSLAKGAAKGKGEAEVLRMLADLQPEFKDYVTRLKAAKAAAISPSKKSGSTVTTHIELFKWLVTRQDLVLPQPTVLGAYGSGRF